MYRLSRAAHFRQLQHVRPRNSLVSQLRQSSQYVYRQNGEQLRFQNVRIKSRRFTWKTIGGLLITGVGLSIISRHLLRGVVLELLGDEETEGLEDGEERPEGEDFDLDEDDPFFIPLTWATKAPRTYYKGSDPEWQAFVKVARDKDLRAKITTELVEMITKYVNKNPKLSQRLGQPTKTGRYWLETSFPDGPPQDYERTGIAIGDGYVALVTQTISPEEHWQLMRMIWPEAAGDSTLATIKVLLGMQYRRLKQALGIEGRDPHSPEEQFKVALDILQRQKGSQGGKQVDKAQTDPSASAGAVVGAPAADNTDRASWYLPSAQLSGSSSTEGPKSIDGPLAYYTFNKELRKKWGMKVTEPPRGTFVIYGLIEVIGTKARVVLDVTSCYDPAKSKYVVVQMGLKALKPKVHSPRGGP